MAGGLDVDLRPNPRGTCPYPECGCDTISIRRRGPQAVANCAKCGNYLFCPSKEELGEPRRKVSTTREGIGPKVETAVFARDGWRCQICGRSSKAQDVFLHIGHILSVKDGLIPEPRLDPPLTDEELNDPANLITLCEAHNLGMGASSVEPRIAARLLLRALADKQRRRG